MSGAGDGERAHLEALLRQVRALSPALRDWTWDDLSAALARAEESVERDLAVAYLNVAEGRLHRLGVLSGDDGNQTVTDLLHAAEEQLAGGAADPALPTRLARVSRGEGLARRACAQIVQLRGNDTVESLVRWEDGVSQAFLLRSGDFPGVITEVHPAPDYRTLALETCSIESGGPVLLLDVATRAWVNANDEYGLALAESGEGHLQDEAAAWQVIGWQPDSSHLLLAVEAQNLAFRLDLETGASERISLAETGETMGGERHLALLSDGSGLAYVEDDGRRLMAYDFATGARTEILQLEHDGGRINYPRFCPGGDRVAFLTEPEAVGSRRQCSLEVVTLADGRHDTLVRESLCLDSPRWSAEGETVALSRGQAGTDSAWMPDPRTGEYLATALDATDDCRVPPFARAELARVMPKGAGLGAEWMAALSQAASGTDTAHFIP